ncbi:MAG TPA: GGDEF domain-containing protein [Steroidobacteraceae bacterium]|nr:GGDEF domain-containing protein [Steroidobacteraceae bacterium]
MPEPALGAAPAWRPDEHWYAFRQAHAQWAINPLEENPNMSAAVEFNPWFVAADSPAGTRDLAMDLSIAAFDADEATAREAMAELLKRPVRRSDEKMQLQLKTMEDLFATLRSMPLIDDLTALYNRRGFVRSGTRLLEAVRRDRHGALLFYFDVDNMNQINDSAGHAAGDAVLVQAAQLLHGVFRNRDIVSRLGGDEFAALAASSDPIGSEVIMGRLREALEASNAASAGPRLSLSVGVARFDPDKPMSIVALMQRADVAMYGHKMTKLLDLAGPLAAPLRPISAQPITD